MRRSALATAVGLAACLAVVPALRAGEEAGPKPPADPRAARAAAHERGLAWLRSQSKDGTFGAPPGATGKADPGLTALGLSALLRRPGGVEAGDRALADKGLAYLLSMQKADGGIYDQQNANYTTSLAVQALAAAGKPEHRAALDRAVAFLRKMQFFEEGGPGRVVVPGDARYGGMGYGSDPTQPDLSNTQFAMESLRAAGVPADDPAMKRALVFLQRTQNRKENETAGEPAEWKDKDGSTVVRSSDGGAGYRPGDSKAGTFQRPDGKRELRSYGSMTYALLKCYAFAGLRAEDPRVADAVKWIREHYGWASNPGFPEDRKAAGAQGLYYYYATAARALALLGEGAAGKGPGGEARDWKADLGAALTASQRPDGSWVNEASERWNEGMPVVATSFALQALAETLK